MQRGHRYGAGGRPGFFSEQPDIINLENRHGDRESLRDKDIGGNAWIDDAVCLLAGGDITKRDAILWGCTLEGVKPYLKYRGREALFREAVIAALGVRTQDEIEDEYCAVCRRSPQPKDCSKCDRKIAEVKNE